MHTSSTSYWRNIKLIDKAASDLCSFQCGSCDDELPSRMVFGPFTTEQVEDVKTFLRLLVIVALGTVTVLFGEIFAFHLLMLRLYKLMSVNTCAYK